MDDDAPFEPTDDSQEAREFRCRVAEDMVAELVRRIDPGAMATKFVLLVETVDPDGVRAPWFLAPDETKVYDRLGLIEYARMREYHADLLARLDDR